MKKLQISLPDDLRDRLDAVIAKSGNSLGEEIRQRLERTLLQDADPKTAKLLAAIQDFAVWTRLYTDHAWHQHPAASRALRRAILARIARQWGKSVEDATFKPNELPTARMVDSDDPDTMGLSIEAMLFHMPPVSEERLRQANEAAMEKIRKLDEENNEH
jgi:hypothetical protein